ncbi:unnamed protein product [Parnassius mnemosyne]|uniref:Reverse transcriptase domain-containing protein n=1 Tax=Parnassius mnemosyne TaxID=213953 RepID=A0AAV1KI72_9NEOP
MGDFNTDLLVPTSPRSSKLLHIVESVGLHILPLQATHHNTDGNDTWLDLILTSSPTLVSSHGQHLASGFSHHDLIFLSYVRKPPKLLPKILHMRCFGRMDLEELCLDASKLKWDSVVGASTVDEKVSAFNDTILKLYDVHAPVKRVKVKRPHAPWMTRGVRIAMTRSDRAFQRFRRERSEERWNLYKAARNRCNQMIRNAKRRYILDNIISSSSADIWKFLRTLGIGKQPHFEFQGTLGLDDINRHLVSHTPLDHQTKCHTVDYLNGLPCLDIDPFHFSPVASDEIKKIILSIKSNAVGCDNISRRMIIYILDHILPVISHIINFSLNSGVFPSLWRMAHIIPLPKTSNPTLPNHFRPISILPFLSKILEACVHRQLSLFVYKNNLLSPFQSGFRPGHSTVSALLKVTDDIRAGMEDTKVTVLALVDFSNAFNTISHDILLSILSHSMISSEALDWFSTYLRGRQQSVRIGESASSWCDINAGVPQGGILSPLLFSVFINLITHNLQCAYHLYADDLQLYAQANVDCLSVAVDMVNKDLEHIKSWSDRFGLSVNPSKCQAIILGSHRTIKKVDTTALPAIIFNGSVLGLCSSVKDLGLNIDSTLSWHAQVTNVSQKVTGTLWALYRLKNFLPSGNKTLLVQSLILPLIDYCDVCYFDLNADLLDKYDRLLNNCIRFIFNLRKYDHVSTYRSQLKWLPIRQRRSVRALTTLYSILMSPTPPSYLTSHFQYLCSSHDRNLRSSNNLLLKCPSHKSGFLHSSFTVQSVHLWNALPLEIRTADNRYAFKKKIREHYFNKLAESSHL